MRASRETWLSIRTSTTPKIANGCLQNTVEMVSINAMFTERSELRKCKLTLFKIVRKISAAKNSIGQNILFLARGPDNACF